jgi:hypothetical protein
MLILIIQLPFIEVPFFWLAESLTKQHVHTYIGDNTKGRGEEGKNIKIRGISESCARGSKFIDELQALVATKKSVDKRLPYA